MMFQSTHSRGVRLNQMGAGAEYAQFQSTHSRGVRQDTHFFTFRFVCFNPRTHEECDIDSQ